MQVYLEQPKSKPPIEGAPFLTWESLVFFLPSFLSFRSTTSSSLLHPTPPPHSASMCERQAGRAASKDRKESGSPAVWRDRGGFTSHLPREEHGTLAETDHGLSQRCGKHPGTLEQMVLDCGGNTMAEIPKGQSSEEAQQKRVRGFAPCMQEDGSPAPTQAAAVGSQSPSTSNRAGSLLLRQGYLTSFSRSLSRSSRRSGNWTGDVDPVRLSVGWGSMRRKGLKEILLQTSQAKPTWRTASQREKASVDIQQDQDSPLDPNSEDLSFVLDPLEHEWMLTVAQGDAESILRLLAKDLSLLSRKDFVTGFTVLHWLAKHGRHEDLIEVITFAEKNHYPVDVDVLTASGRFTPLHLAALQGHEMAIKVLVGAYGANTSLRDHNGRKAWQYLRADAPRELKELLGACEEDLALGCEGNTNNNCAPSKWSTRLLFKGGASEASGGRQNQGAVPRLSYFRNVFRQAIAFFQDL